MKRLTRRALGTAAGSLLAAAALPAAAQATWPARPVRIVVPYPPGTGPDIMARAVAEGLAREFRGSFIVENKPGANAILGTDTVAKAPADGHTLLLVDRMTFSVNPLLYAPLPFDPRKDFVAVSNVADVNLYLAVSAALPVNDWKGFIDYAKQRPGQVPFGTGGAGSIMHLNMELIQAATGAQFLHVPYKALAEVVPAMLGGQVAATSGGAEALLPHAKAGKMKLLAVGADTRVPITPDVPTARDAAGADVLMSTSWSLHARAGTPADVTSKLQAALAKVLGAPELQEWTSSRGMRARASAGREVEAQIAADGERLGRLVRERGIRVQ
jgi:tripartite-type tricarboxylate transporter receptor subunit TctC